MEPPSPDETPWQTPGRPALPIGHRIRTRRKALDMTLRDLAQRSGLSAPFISQAERNLTVPSLPSLVSLAGALGVEIGYFMAVGQSEKVVSRADEPRRIKIDSPVEYYDLTAEFDGRRMDAMLIHIPPGYTFRVDRHRGEHFRFVLQGEVYATAGEIETILKPGDSMHFDALLPHVIANRSDRPAVMLHVGSQDAGKGGPTRTTTDAP